MTVGELIEKLMEHDLNKKVLLERTSYARDGLYGVYQVVIRRSPDEEVVLIK